MSNSSRLRFGTERRTGRMFSFYQSVFIGNRLLFGLVGGCELSTRDSVIDTSRVCKSTVEGEAKWSRLIYAAREWARLGGADDQDAS